jgi:S1-C subfamily serine protease
MYRFTVSLTGTHRQRTRLRRATQRGWAGGFALAMLLLPGCPLNVVDLQRIDANASRERACLAQKPASERTLALHRSGGAHIAEARPRGAAGGTPWNAEARQAWDSLKGGGGSYLLRFQQGETRDEAALVVALPPGRTRGQVDAGGEIYRRNVDRVALIESPDGRLGAGTLVEPRILVTNFHVVAGEPEVAIYFRPPAGGPPRPEDVTPGTVIAAMPRKDLALVEIHEPQTSRSPVRLGELDSIEVGSDVYAIGHPEGLLWSFTTGTVSQIRRNHAWAYNVFISHEATVIQNQTPINPGNSGGPLFNRDGQVIGINSYGVAEATGLNFAVAVDEIRQLLSQRPAPPPLELKPLAESDLDRDGRTDTIIFDRDGNGEGDFWVYDFDGDEQADMASVDMDYNGVPDVFLFDQNQDGTPDAFHRDANEDGAIEVIALDHDGDGTIDEVFQC